MFWHWHEQELCVFEVETTGTNPEHDRIITAAIRSWTRTHGRHRLGPPTARFNSQAALAYCPAESRDTPHTFDVGDVGRRRCLVCKTTTTTPGDSDDG